MTGDELIRAYQLGDRAFARANLARANLEGAYLAGANLEGAYLAGANLAGAYLIRVPGIYRDVSPFLSSRGAALDGGLDIVDGVVTLRFWAGCQERKTADELRARVAATHGDGEVANLHAQHYKLAIAHMEAQFALDMAAHKWDYLLTWEADHAPNP